MIDNIKLSLQDLERSFMTNSQAVNISAEKLDEQLKHLSNVTGDSAKSTQISDTVKLIEKLSIQNDYKLNLLKDFSEHVFNKK